MTWPLYQWYLGRFAIADGVSFALEPTAGALSGHTYTVPLTGRKYYLFGYTGESQQLAEQMQIGIRTIGGSPFPAATVTVSSTTGKMTIDTQYGSACTVHWTNASSLQTSLGFGTCTGASSYTAASVARYQWRPSEPLATYSCGDPLRWWNRHSRTIAFISPEGSISTTVRGALYDGEYSYELLPKADVVISEGVSGWEPLEQFFGDVVDAGEPIRCYPDRTLSDSAHVYEAQWVGPEEGIGGFDTFRFTSVDTWDALWNIKFKLAKYLAAS
jgi:hypothetical protein